MSYASLTEAREAGGHVRFIAEIDLVDADSLSPTGYFGNNDKTIRLGAREDGRWLINDASQNYVEPLVESFGVISQRCDIGEAFGAISDLRLVLNNSKLEGQQDNSEYSGITGAMSPEPTGDDVRLIETAQFYTWTGASVSVWVYFFPGGETALDLVTGEQSTQVFIGVINEVDVDGDLVYLDVVQNDEAEQTSLPGREITDPPGGIGRGQRIPICYGKFAAANPAEISSLTGGRTNQDTTISPRTSFLGAVIAGYKGPVAPAVPWKYESSPASPSVPEYYLVTSDFKAPNSGWTNQDQLSGDPVDALFIYHGDGVTTHIDEGSALGETETQEVSGAGTTEQLFHKVFSFQQGWAYIPCDSVESSSGQDLTGVQNVFNGDPSVSWDFDGATSGNYINFRIKNTAPLGEVISSDNCVEAWAILDSQSGRNTAYQVRWGLWRLEASAEWVGSAGGTRNVYVNDAGGTTPLGFHVQDADASASIREQDYYQDRASAPNFYQPEELLSWRWRYSNAGTAGTDGVVIRFYANTNATAGDVTSIIACGLRVKYRFARSLVTVPTALAFRAHGTPVKVGKKNGRVGERVIGPNAAATRGIEPVYSENWACPNVVVRDDGSGTITGTADGNIWEGPLIAAHLCSAWGSGVAATDVLTAASQFGSTRDTNDELDDWVDDLGSATTYDYHVVIDQETTMESAIAQIASQGPWMFHKTPTGKFYAAPYWEAPPTTGSKTGSGHFRYWTQATNAYAKFHPGVNHPDASDAGKPFAFDPGRFRVRLTPLSEIYNRFRVRYGFYRPTGKFERTLILTETAGDSNVWSNGATSNEDTPTGLASSIGGGYNLSTICTDSQARYGVTREMVVELPDIWDHPTATAYLHYLVKRYSGQRMIVSATTGIEGFQLYPGHVVRFSNDCNLIQPRLDYINNPAEQDGWDDLDFIVQSVKIDLDQKEVSFSCEQIIYDPS